MEIKDKIKGIFSKIKTAASKVINLVVSKFGKDVVISFLAAFIFTFVPGLFNTVVALIAGLIVSCILETYREYKVDGSGYKTQNVVSEVIGIILGLIL